MARFGIYRQPTFTVLNRLIGDVNEKISGNRMSQITPGPSYRRRPLMGRAVVIPSLAHPTLPPQPKVVEQRPLRLRDLRNAKG